MCIANPEGSFIEVNDVFVTALGYSKEQLLSKNFYELMHPDDIQETQSTVTRIKAGGKAKNFENRYQHANGSFKVLSWSASIDKASRLIYAMAREVTDEAMARDRLLQIESGLESEAIIAETDKQGRINFVNDNFCKISGYGRSELLGKTHRVINSGQHPPEFFADLWKKISTGLVWAGIIQNRKKNGDYYYVQTLIIPLRDIVGDINGYLSIRQDLTESIKHKAAFTKTLNILNETSAIAKVGGWELDVASGELTWTDETFKILEVEKHNDQKPMLPEGLQLFIPEHQSIVENAVNNAALNGIPYELEVMAMSARGRIFWVYTNGQPNYIDGKIVNVSGTIQDIDLRKTAQLNYDKERLISMQNAKMTSLGEVAASMAHEKNNPLGIIVGYTDLLLETGVENKDISKILSSILKASDRIGHIVQGLKKFSRTDAERDFETCQILTIVQEAIELARPRLKNQHVKLNFIGKTKKALLCRPIEVEQVILNFD